MIIKYWQTLPVHFYDAHCSVALKFQSMHIATKQREAVQCTTIGSVGFQMPLSLASRFGCKIVELERRDECEMRLRTVRRARARVVG